MQCSPGGCAGGPSLKRDFEYRLPTRDGSIKSVCVLAHAGLVELASLGVTAPKLGRSRCFFSGRRRVKQRVFWQPMIPGERPYA
jgi:hypothetical protein